MSNDHIFAAQMWSWADPMIKRDSYGRILVVNAAFLQLYGGTVESWTGNPVQGWPNPKTAGESSRFESRIPLESGGEIVYDWMECTLADGTALAMARDVSAYAAAAMPVIQEPQMTTEPVMETAEPAPQQAPMMDQSGIQDELGALSPLAAQQAVPVEPAAPIAPVPTPEIVAETPAPVAAVQPRTPAPEPAPAPSPVPEAAPAAPQAQTPQPPAAVAPQPAPTAPVPTQASTVADDRAYERRALPIEDGDAILGNNWRDAVIAKAVGAEDEVEGEAEQVEDTPPAAVASDGGQIRVLLAEDNAINALLTRTLLEAEGCICDVVEDGALAVEAVKNHQYHMIFMDMRMPNMDGLEATRKIRSMGYGAKVLPIVALTANAFDDDRNACFDSGMNDFMTKPVSAEELSAMVKTHTALEAEKIAG